MNGGPGAAAYHAMLMKCILNMIDIDATARSATMGTRVVTAISTDPKSNNGILWPADIARAHLVLLLVDACGLRLFPTQQPRCASFQNFSTYILWAAHQIV